MNLKKIFSSLFCLSILWTQTNASQKLVGKKAPLFTAQAVFPDETVCDFNLQDYIGCDIVLYFYPVDNTPGCTKQAQNFRDGIKKLHDHNIMLIGISCDSIKSHLKFQKQHALPYPLVSDSRWKRTIAKQYGVAGFLYSKRRTFLINKKGIIFKIFDHVDIQNQIEDILNCFAMQNEK